MSALLSRILISVGCALALALVLTEGAFLGRFFGVGFGFIAGLLGLIAIISLVVVLFSATPRLRRTRR